MTEATGSVRHYPLRSLLLLLMLVLVVPALVLSAVIVGRAVTENRAAAERRLLGEARELAGRIDREMASSFRTLDALAASESLSTGDLAAFRREAARYLPSHPAWFVILLTAPDGRHVVNTGREQDVGLADVADLESFAEILKTQAPTIGHLRRGRAGGRLGLPIRVPVVRDGALRYVLSAVLAPEGLAAAVAIETGGEEWVRVLLDARAVVVARTRDPERFVGDSATPDFLALLAGRDEGLVQSVTLDGALVYSAVSLAPVTRWRAVVAVPRAVVEAELRHTMMVLGVLAIALLGIGGIGSYFIARWIARDISMVTAAAAALVGGRPVQVTRPRVEEVRQLAMALESSAALIKAREQERDARVSRADAARAEAEAATRAKDEFLAMLGHELRNPLSPVLNALHAARARGGSMAEREQHVIERQVRHMARLVDDLLDMSRLRRGKVSLRYSRIELAAVAAGAVEMTRPLLEDNAQVLTLDLPDGLVVVGDEHRIAQVLTNLLANAAKYTARHGNILLTARQDGDSAVIECVDDGIGMTRDLIERVFDPFVQGARGLDRREGGLGLGLAIARTLVELHGGTIAAHSDGEGRGSRFVVRLPLHPRDAVVEAPPDAPPEATTLSRALRVLVVEDNDDVRDMLVLALGMCGAGVKGAATAGEALTLAAGWRPNVAVLDIGLPDVNGFELARRLRREYSADDLFLIALTGYGSDAHAVEAREAGFDRFLVKPVGIDAVITTIAGLQAQA